MRTRTAGVSTRAPQGKLLLSPAPRRCLRREKDLESPRCETLPPSLVELQVSLLEMICFSFGLFTLEYGLVLRVISDELCRLYIYIYGQREMNECGGSGGSVVSIHSEDP